MTSGLQGGVKNKSAFTASGYLDGDGSYIAWTAAETESIGSVAGNPYTGVYSALDGSMASLAAYFAATNWTNQTLLAQTSPSLSYGIGLWAMQLNTTAVETVSYTFSSPVPAWETFSLVDPGASYPEYSGSETFKISATYNGAAVSTSGWIFNVVTPTGAAVASNISVNAATGVVTVASYSGATWPDAIVLIQPNTAVTSISVTANTIPYDFWTLTLPHLPSALLFQSVNQGPNGAGVMATWQLNGGTINGGGSIGNPGSAWVYEGTGNFAGDGASDLLFRNQNGAISYWVTSGTSILTGYFPGNPGAGWQIAGLADFNGDGDTDILFEDSNADFAVWMMNGATIINGGGVIGNPGTGWTYLGTGDFNGDGDADILFENASGDFVYWAMRGATIASIPNLGNAPSGYTFAGIGDFNGDGISDVLLRNAATGQYVAWLLSSNGTVAQTATLATPGPTSKLVSIGAYGLGAASDLMIQNSLTGNVTEYVINNAATTNAYVLGNAGVNFTVATAPWAKALAIAPTVVYGDASGDVGAWTVPKGVGVASTNFGSPGGGWTFLGAGDFNGDQKPDFLFQNGAGQLDIMETDGVHMISNTNIGSASSGWSYAGLGDFNGDGQTDILFTNGSGSYVDWMMDGTSVIGSGSLGGPGGSYALRAIADITGDGTSDLIFENSSGNYVAWFAANGGFAGQSTISQLATNYTLMGTGDFNGDGRADLLFYNTSTGGFSSWDLNGAAVIGGGAVSTPGAGWSYFGIAALNGDLNASIVWENSSGVLQAGLMNDNNVASWSVISGPGSPWTALTVI